MYLLALGAFWRRRTAPLLLRIALSLNAPFGALCFLTIPDSKREEFIASSLNAPFSARCSLTRALATVPRERSG